MFLGPYKVVSNDPLQNTLVEERCFGCFAIRVGTNSCSECSYNDQGINPNPTVLPAGTLLNNQYIVGKVLGQGGFGITYLGWDRDLNLKVALKEYFPTQWASRDQTSSAVSVHSQEAGEYFRSGLEKFLEEGRTLARFHNHPGIVSVISFFRQNNTGYLAMSYIEGITFKEYLTRQGGKIPASTAIKVLLPIMDALSEVHEAGVLHRDISPDNIYITNSGQVKLLDFGAARFALTDAQKSLSVIYKPGFAPPEQYMSQGKQGRWTDVYALAATLYMAITGITPAQSVERFYKDELQLPSALGIATAPHIEVALARALAVDFTQRFQSMREFQQALGHDGTVSIPLPYVKKSEPLKDAAKASGIDWTVLHGMVPAKRLWLGALVVILVAGFAYGGFRLFASPSVVDSPLIGRWEMAQALDGTPLGSRWQLKSSGAYTVDYTYKDQGELNVHGGDGWVFASKNNLSRAGNFKFVDASTVQMMGLPLTLPAGITLKRRNAALAAGSSKQFSLIGVWDNNFRELGTEGKRTLSVTEAGEYNLIIVGHGEGTIQAKQGLYKVKSSIDGSEDYGTYSFLDPNTEQPNRVQFMGRTVPIMMWQRMLEAD